MHPTPMHFVQYNLLSPNLAGASHYSKSPPIALEPNRRFTKICEKLAPHLKRRAIIGLQEVPLSWSGPLLMFFKASGYTFISSLYGHKFDGFMGVGIGLPDDYALLDMDVVVPAARASGLNREYNLCKKKERIAAEKSVSVQLQKAFMGILSLLPFRPIFEPALRYVAKKAGLTHIAANQTAGGWSKKKTPQQYVASRVNRAIFLRLQSPCGREFVVGVYHMPCIWWDADVMTMHTTLVVEALSKFAGKTPMVLLGDFNIKPEDDAYVYVTTGKIPGSSLDRIQKRIFSHWYPQNRQPLRSAYCLAAGLRGKNGEPEYTNHTFSGGKPFTGTLDYIFVSPDFEVDDVIATGKLSPETVCLIRVFWRKDAAFIFIYRVLVVIVFFLVSQEICPNMDEPSDHILIGATLIQTQAPSLL